MRKASYALVHSSLPAQDWPQPILEAGETWVGQCLAECLRGLEYKSVRYISTDDILCKMMNSGVRQLLLIGGESDLGSYNTAGYGRRTQRRKVLASYFRVPCYPEKADPAKY
jgi:hypothetical protein